MRRSDVLLALMLVTPVSGQGIELRTSADLEQLRNNGNHYQLMKPITGLGTWQPIEGFYGILDGNNYVIGGYQVASTDLGGLFAALNGATIRNLTLLAPVVRGRVVGALAGSARNSNIDTVEVLRANLQALEHAGGLVGSVEGGVARRVLIRYGTVEGNRQSSGKSITLTGANGTNGMDFNGGPAGNGTRLADGYFAGGVFGRVHGSPSSIEQAIVLAEIEAGAGVVYDKGDVHLDGGNGDYGGMSSCRLSAGVRRCFVKSLPGTLDCSNTDVYTTPALQEACRMTQNNPEPVAYCGPDRSGDCAEQGGVGGLGGVGHTGGHGGGGGGLVGVLDGMLTVTDSLFEGTVVSGRGQAGLPGGGRGKRGGGRRPARQSCPSLRPGHWR